MNFLTERLTPSTQIKLYGLDHLRALAILLVFCYHYPILSSGNPEWLQRGARFGWTGVDLFFVLSGFLISSQLFLQIKQGRNISLKNFYIKRFFRILPAFWVVVAVYFCFPGFREREALPPIWKFLTFTQNFGLNIFDFGTFSHAWSLCVEEHFYLFFPLILILLQSTNLFKKSYWLLIFLFLIGIVIRVFIWENFYLPEKIDWYKYIYYPTYNRIDGLLMGVSIAGIYQFRPDIWNKISKYGNPLIALSLLVLTAAYFLCDDQHSFNASVFGFPLVSVGYGLIVSGALCPTSFLYRWNSKVTTFIAMLSYAIYLTHKGIIHITQQIFASLNIDLNSNVMMLICIITCVSSAYTLHIVIEKPFMNLRDKILSRK